MAGKILGIQIDGEALAAVLMSARAKGLDLFDHVRIPLLGDLRAAVKGLKERWEERPDATYLSIGFERVSFRSLKLPFKDPKAISKALPYELESLMPFPLEDRIIDFTYSWNGQGSDVLCAVAPKEELNQIVNVLNEFRLEPEIIDIDLAIIGQFVKTTLKRSDYILAILKEQYLGICVVERGEIKTLRNIEIHKNEKKEETYSKIISEVNLTFFYHKNVISPEYSPEEIILFDTQTNNDELVTKLQDSLNINAIRLTRKIYDQYQFPAELSDDMLIPYATAMFGIKNRSTFNFSKQILSKPSSLYYPLVKNFRLAFLLLFAALILFGANQLLNLYALETRYKELDRRLNFIYQKTFGQTTVKADPVAEAQARLNELKKRFKEVEFKAGGVPVIDTLCDLLSRLPDGISVQLSRIVLDQESIQISGSADDYNTVDMLKNELGSSGFVQEVNIHSAKVDKTGKTVNFELRVKRKI